MGNEHANEAPSPRYARVMSPASLDLLRRAFRRMNRGMVLLWRLGLGRMAGVWPRGFGRLLVIEHTGAVEGANLLVHRGLLWSPVRLSSSHCESRDA